MAGPKGCFKGCLIGCAAFLALLIAGGAIMAGLAWRSLNRGAHVSGEIHASAEPTAGAVSEPMIDRAARLTTTRGGTVKLTLGDGETRAGIVRDEQNGMVRLQTAAEGELQIPAARIRGRDRAASAMPEGLGELMTRGELRDLIEALSR
jgi:hypothetical protein